MEVLGHADRFEASGFLLLETNEDVASTVVCHGKDVLGHVGKSVPRDIDCELEIEVGRLPLLRHEEVHKDIIQGRAKGIFGCILFTGFERQSDLLIFGCAYKGGWGMCGTAYQIP